eukprot:scpid87706/ scgid27240/ Sushi, von Willebrand factor type A, EGF and pentraxin domain-containing protein 1
MMTWVIILTLFTATWMSVVAEGTPYVEKYNCNDEGKYLISTGTVALGSAKMSCTSQNYDLLQQKHINTSCIQGYLAHINTVLSKVVLLYVSNGMGSVTCYPLATPCPANALVICNHTLTLTMDTMCNDTLQVANGKITYPSGLQFPSEAFLSCDTGYDKSSAGKYASCPEEGGDWSDVSGQVCNAIICPKPSITNGRLIGTAPKFFVVCNADHVITGDPVVSCTSHNTTTILPSCQPNCFAPGIPHARLSSTQIHVGTVLNITCDCGYEISGPQEIICQDSQVWTQKPTCQEIMCTGSVSAPMNGHVTSGGNTLSAVRQFTCMEGYQLSGATYTICQTDGSWSAASPMCTQITCT